MAPLDRDSFQLGEFGRPSFITKRERSFEGIAIFWNGARKEPWGPPAFCLREFAREGSCICRAAPERGGLRTADLQPCCPGLMQRLARDWR